MAGIPGSNAAVSSAYDGAVAYVDLEARTVELLGYHDHLANKITVNNEGTLAASSSSDYTVYIWDLVKRQRQQVLLGHSDDVEDFVFVDDKTGVSVSRDWRILVWNLKTGAVSRVIEGHEKDVLSVVYSDGRIYTSGDDMTLRVWDLSTGELIKMWGPFENETDSCAIDAIHGRAVLGCDDGVIRVFDIESSATLAEIEAHASGIKKVATSPINGDILSAAYDQKILVWDANDFSQKVELERRATTWERSFNWTPDGKRILAGTFDGTVLVWDAETGKCLDEVGERGTGNICLNDVSANQQGEIATVSDDGFVRLGKLSDTVARVDHTGRTGLRPDAGQRRDHGRRIWRGDLRSARSETAHLRETGTFPRQGDRGDARRRTDQLRACRTSSRLRGPGIRGLLQRGHRAESTATARFKVPFVSTMAPSKPCDFIRNKTIGVSCSADGALLAWDFEGNLLQRFPGHMAIVDDVDIDPGGDLITSVSRDFTMKVYRIDDGKLLHSFSSGTPFAQGRLFLRSANGDRDQLLGRAAASRPGQR